MKLYSSHGLEHWGSDSQGVENTRRFLLEWMSFLHRYVPVGLMEVAPQRLNWRIPKYYGRSDLETLLGSEDPNDWVKISTMLLVRARARALHPYTAPASAVTPAAAATDSGAARLVLRCFCCRARHRRTSRLSRSTRATRTRRRAQSRATRSISRQWGWRRRTGRGEKQGAGGGAAL